MTMLRSVAVGARLAALGVRAPRRADVGWQRYWAGIGGVGDRGDVLWDTDSTAEFRHCAELAGRYFDPLLPIVDIGCGNGRWTVGFATMAPRVLGVDGAASAIDRARRGPLPGNVTFAVEDILQAGAGRRIRELVGEANVFIRGVLHVLSASDRVTAVAQIRTVVGGRGRILLMETNFPGGMLAYAQTLGARPGFVPDPLARAVQNLPRPRPFGTAELRRSFPAGQWQVLDEDSARISVLPMGTSSAEGQTIPGHVAVLQAISTGPAESGESIA